MENYLQELNEAQRIPVLQKDGAMMVIAGAGSGKTRVLTYRIVHLMSQGVDPFNILSLTFTNKAAREMQQRVAQMVGRSEAGNLWMGTFHSIFARILRVEADKLGYPRNFTIYDSQDSQSVIRAIIRDKQLDRDVYKYKQIQSRISSFKNNLITVNAYFNDTDLVEADAMAKRPRMGDIYKEYVARCFKAGAMDFDDLLLKTNELLTKYPEVLAKYQDRFRYILVDEYQDTNHSQYLIIRALSDKFQNICVVGDDAQSIYAFRGANINNIFNFQKDYDNVQVYRLEQNYRSTSVIVEAANSVIENNEQRLEKEVWTDNEPGAPIKVHLSPTDADEGRFVAASIVENIEQNENDYADYAILYRTNAQSRALEDALRRRNVPYRIYGGLSFYQRKEIKDVLSYLRLLVNPKDEEALKRVINYPARGIGQTTIDRLTIAANHYERSIYEVIENIDRIDLKINAGIRTRLKNFLILIKSLTVSAQSMDAFELTDLVSRKTGLVTEFKKDSSPEGMLRVENLEELLNGIKDFVEQQKEIDGATGDITEFLEDVALATDLDKDVADNNRVALMTVHLAKGLEFPYVYIVGLEENLFPSGMNLNSRSELEEERRLFYVALTRAEKQAYLTYAQSRYQWGKLTDAEPSRFIDEIDDKFLKYLSPQGSRRFRSLTNFDKFDEVDKDRYRQVKPVAGTPPKGPNMEESRKLRRLKPVSSLDKAKVGVRLEKGQIVEHNRFGKGRVLHVEGVGGDAKAEIQFDNGGLKRLILRFAKLEILS